MITPGDIVYISGPMTGKPNLNRHEFNHIEHLLFNYYGCVVLSPVQFPGDRMDYEKAMKIDFAMIEVSDWIVQMTGWEDSPGAKREFEHAKKHGVKPIHQRDLDFDIPLREPSPNITINGKPLKKRKGD